MRPADPAGWAERYAAGETLREIAAPLGISQATVRKYVLQAGVEMRSRGSLRPRPRPAWYARAVELRRLGLLHKQIAHEVGRARPVVTRVLRREGVS